MLTLGEGVGEGTFGQVFKAKLLLDPSTIISNNTDNGGDSSFTSSYVKNMRDSSSSSISGFLWLKRAARGMSPTRESDIGSDRGSDRGSKVSDSEYGEVAVKVMRASTRRHLELIESEVVCPYFTLTCSLFTLTCSLLSLTLLSFTLVSFLYLSLVYHLIASYLLAITLLASSFFFLYLLSLTI